MSPPRRCGASLPPLCVRPLSTQLCSVPLWLGGQPGATRCAPAPLRLLAPRFPHPRGGPQALPPPRQGEPRAWQRKDSGLSPGPTGGRKGSPRLPTPGGAGTLFTHFCFSVASTFAKTGLLTFGGLGRGGSLGRVWPGAWQAEVPPGAATRAGGWARPGRRRAPAPRTERVCGGSASRPQSSLATAAIGEAALPLQDPPQARRGAQHGTRAS